MAAEEAYERKHMEIRAAAYKIMRFLLMAVGKTRCHERRVQLSKEKGLRQKDARCGQEEARDKEKQRRLAMRQQDLATQIQAVFRGYCARGHAEHKEFVPQTNVAIMLQCKYRVRLASSVAAQRRVQANNDRVVEARMRQGKIPRMLLLRQRRHQRKFPRMLSNVDMVPTSFVSDLKQWEDEFRYDPTVARREVEREWKVFSTTLRVNYTRQRVLAINAYNKRLYRFRTSCSTRTPRARRASSRRRRSGSTSARRCAATSTRRTSMNPPIKAGDSVRIVDESEFVGLTATSCRSTRAWSRTRSPRSAWSRRRR